MRIGLVIVIGLLVVGCSSTTDMTRATYEDNGRVYSVTDCPQAANLLIGGYDAADALPAKGQTEQERVEGLLDDVQSYYSGTSVQAVNLIHRNGEVWYRLDDGDYAVELAEDYQFEIVLTSADRCPSAPVSWNGIPLLYNVEGS